MKIYNHKDAYIHLQYILRNQTEDAFIAVFDETAIHYGVDGGFDLAKAIELKIPYYDIYRKGSAFVTSPGDVVYCFCSKNHNTHYNRDFSRFLMKKLIARGIDAEETENDLLAFGKKCLGQMYIKINDIAFYGGHISLNCNLELIKQLCTKPMEKVPGGLEQYGITTKDIIDWLNEFWFYHKK
jgi:hypothetical protein